ncbi:hypothetical protein MPSD_31320 [Mycobacterium pseudoshottsii JCM 15466]|uniref:Uncharacterized protein n=1 Tax=Mycobacterium pseudoshottsii TaxID=265949 RepID=A0A9N7LTP5_9MYCO|nr:hypothetical protein MPSD_31320 [Mycobacterium pseudoshottsii JCM 15466]BDN82852.1 hypothetical protein NJB1907Z4_C30670 [Mycobacterium pseudoshottsii]
MPEGLQRMARRARWQVNNERIRQLGREEGLRVSARVISVATNSPTRPNQRDRSA